MHTYSLIIKTHARGYNNTKDFTTLAIGDIIVSTQTKVKLTKSVWLLSMQINMIVAVLSNGYLYS